MPEEKSEEYASKQAGGHKALRVMEVQLGNTPYIAGEKLTTADIPLYAYTHVAHEGGIELESYPAIRAWLERVASQPNFKAMA